MSKGEKEVSEEKAAEKPEVEAAESEKPKKDPAARWTRRVLSLCVLFFIWYLISDRFAPYTAQARVRGYVVQLVPQVSGEISGVFIGLNEEVEDNQLLAKISSRDYEIAVEDAKADLEQAGQDVGANTADVDSATAGLAEARAQLDLDKKQAARVVQASKTAAVSQADVDKVQSQVALSEAQLKNAQAALEQARQRMGEAGKDNPKIRAAQAALEDALLDLARTEIRAPGDGGITNGRVEVGQYANAGQPLMTFVSTRAVWVEAYLRENSIGRIKPGDSVDIVLDVAPGRIFKGKVQSIGFGVEWGNADSADKLPKVSAPRDWLRDPQRFPVIINFEGDETVGLRREGAQADVVVYTGDNGVVNGLSRLWMRVVSWFSYVG